MTQILLNPTDVDFELRKKFQAGRYDGLREVQRYMEKEAKNAFMVFTAEGDARAFELRSLAAMVGRMADATDKELTDLKEAHKAACPPA